MFDAYPTINGYAKRRGGPERVALVKGGSHTPHPPTLSPVFSNLAQCPPLALSPRPVRSSRPDSARCHTMRNQLSHIAAWPRIRPKAGNMFRWGANRARARTCPGRIVQGSAGLQDEYAASQPAQIIFLSFGQMTLTSNHDQIIIGPNDHPHQGRCAPAAAVSGGGGWGADLGDGGGVH